MAVSADQIQAYATQFLPQFRWEDSERIFPVSVDSWLEQCAEGDWQNATDPHRGTTVVSSAKTLSITSLAPSGGCRGVTAAAGPVGTPLDPTQPLPVPDGFKTGREELFLDFAGWSSLPGGNGFVAGDDEYIRGFFTKYFTLFNGQLSDAPQPPTRTEDPVLPTEVVIYCEAAWAGQYTRLSIQNNCWDFATASTSDPADLIPDPELDPFFVLSYYLFYPCTEPPPNNANLSPGSPNLLYREGQWEAVSLYFNAAPAGGVVSSASDLVLPQSPATVTPDWAVLSQGITASGDGYSPQIGSCYPAQSGTWPAGGDNVLSGGFPSYGEELVPQSVFVTCGTHKNLFSATPVTTTPDPNQGVLAAGSALEGAGGIVAGTTGGTGVGLVIGALLWLIGLIISLIAAGETSSSPAPDSSGDIASDTGPATNTGGGSGESTPGTPSTVVDTSLVVLSGLPGLGGQLEPPAWWPFPGRWGVAMNSDTGSWDSGGRLSDFQGRTRAYWNTAALQFQQQL